MRRGTFGVYDRLKSIGFLGMGKTASCGKNGWTNLMIYTLDDLFLRLLGVAMIAPALKVLVALSFLIAIDSLICYHVK